MQTLDLKKKKWIGKKEIIVVLTAIILTTAGIKASDKVFNGKGEDVYEGTGCPPDMVEVNLAERKICIDKYEASAGDDCDYKNPGTQEETKTNLDMNKCKAVSRSGVLPWTNISQSQAQVACAKAGKRLPTNKEWMQASLGTPDKKNGWGNDDCNVARNWETSPGPTGSGVNCLSANNAYDMIGNVWEWVSDTAFDGKYKGRELPKKGYIKGVDEDGAPTETTIDQGDPNYNEDYFFSINIGSRAFARGGHWDNKSDAGQYAVYLESPPSFAGIGIGFRCAK